MGNTLQFHLTLPSSMLTSDLRTFKAFWHCHWFGLSISFGNMLKCQLVGLTILLLEGSHGASEGVPWVAVQVSSKQGFIQILDEWGLESWSVVHNIYALVQWLGIQICVWSGAGVGGVWLTCGGTPVSSCSLWDPDGISPAGGSTPVSSYTRVH